MRTINFTLTLLAVFSCMIAMIGAMPINDDGLAGGIARRQRLRYVPLQQHWEYDGYFDSTEKKLIL
jgi:hypothetical protein